MSLIEGGIIIHNMMYSYLFDDGYVLLIMLL